MKRKIACILLGIVCSFGSLSVFGCNGSENGGSAATVWCALSSEVFMREQQITSYPDAEIEISAMKGNQGK